MARIHQGLKVIFGPVSFVHGEVKCRVVSPAVVAVEFVHGHQFQRLNAKRFEVVQRVDDELERTLLREVPNEQLVNDQVLLIWALKAAVGPLKRHLARREDTYWSRRVIGWVSRHVWVRAFGDPGVIPLV